MVTQTRRKTYLHHSFHNPSTLISSIVIYSPTPTSIPRIKSTPDVMAALSIPSPRRPSPQLQRPSTAGCLGPAHVSKRRQRLGDWAPALRTLFPCRSLVSRVRMEYLADLYVVGPAAMSAKESRAGLFTQAHDGGPAFPQYSAAKFGVCK